MKFQVLKKSELIDTKEFGEGSYKIGRAETADIQLKSPQVSKNHALLVIKDNRAAIVDVGSSNGVFVNGVLVKKQRIKIGDEVNIAEYKLRIADGKNTQPQPHQTNSGIQELPLQKSPQEKLLVLVDKKVLAPLYVLMQTYDWRIILSSILMGTLVLSVLLGVIPVVRWGKHITTKEALNRAHTIVTQTVRENYRILAKSNDMSRLTTEMCESEQGILSCVVIEPKSNSILAPAKLFNKPVNDVYSLIAIKKITESKDEMPSIDVGDGTYIVAEPIYLYSPDTKDRALNAIVLAQFQAPIGVYSTFEPLVEAALFAIFLSLMAYFLIYKMVSYPLLNLQEQIDAALKGDTSSIVSPVKFAELETLAQVINFTISKSKGVDFSSNLGNSDTTELEDTQYLKAIEEMDEASSDALLVLDKNKIVQFVGKALEELIGMRSQYAKGQNISDACKDSAFAGTSIDLCENVVQSLGQTQKAQLDVNGTMREIVAVAHKNSAADIRFIFIVVKMNG